MPSSPLHAAPIEKLVALIYEAALDATRWRDVLAPLCALLNSHVGMIWANDFTTQAIDPGFAGQNVFIQTGVPDAAMVSLAAYYAQRNVWLEDPRLHHEGRVVNGSMLFSSSHLKKTEFWGDWLRHQDIFHTVAAIVEKKNSRSVNVTLCRPESMGEYTAEDMGLMQRLMPHLQAAFDLHHRLYRLQALSQAATGALEKSPFGVILLDHQGQVLFFNRRAATLVGTARLLTLREGGAVRCRLPADDAALQALLADAIRTGLPASGAKTSSRQPGGGLRLFGLDGQQLQLLVTPLPSWSTPFGLRTAAVIFLSDPTAVVGSMTSLLRSVYAMTPAESRLTEALVNGSTPHDYAATCGLSINTVRTQINAPPPRRA